MADISISSPHDFFSHDQADPGRAAVTVVESGKRYARGAAADRARSLAQWFAAQQGFMPGQRFALLLENRIKLLELVLAARLAGVYAMVLSTHLNPAEVAYIVADSAPAFLIASDRTWPQLRQVEVAGVRPMWSVDASGRGRSLPRAPARPGRKHRHDRFDRAHRLPRRPRAVSRAGATLLCPPCCRISCWTCCCCCTAAMAA